MKDCYENLAYFYDQIVGDRNAEVRFLKALVKEYCPKAKSLLEIACGTGSVLQAFASRYSVAGVDLSEQMLALASEKLPGVPLFQMDMRSISLETTFDVILCTYDSINHLQSFGDWKKAFASARKHLSPGGIFIFDMNTLYKLEQLSMSPPLVHDFEESTYIFEVHKNGKNAYRWHARIFVPAAEDGLFSCLEEVIPETSYPLSKVREALAKDFKVLSVRDLEKKRPSPTSERLYLVCRAK